MPCKVNSISSLENTECRTSKIAYIQRITGTVIDVKETSLTLINNGFVRYCSFSNEVHQSYIKDFKIGDVIDFEIKTFANEP